ncbi:hypothetical protein ACP70R_007173 [Stipagrostis hirtigluma subsp. patula]
MAPASPPPAEDQTLAPSDAVLLRVPACLPEPQGTGRSSRTASRTASRTSPTSTCSRPQSPRRPRCGAPHLGRALANPRHQRRPAARRPFLDDDVLDRGLTAVAASFPNLRRL